MPALLLLEESKITLSRYKNLLKFLGLVGIATGIVFTILSWQDRQLALEPRPIPTRSPPVFVPPGPVKFLDVTQTSGLNFVHNNGAFGAKWIPENLGSGAVFLDYDNDGYQDIFFANARNWTEQEIAQYKNGPGKIHKEKFNFDLPPNKPARRTTGALYHNNRDGTFRDVTHNSGLAVEMYGFGGAAGDYDNDGRVDLFVTSLGRAYLFHNESKSGQQPVFREVATSAGVRGNGWTSSAAWVDYDKDGRLDLFVCRYLKWKPESEIQFTTSDLGKVYDGPNSYEAATNLLYRNLGQGRFADVSQKAGISATLPTVKNGKSTALTGHGLGIAVCDSNRDGWPDLLVANDLMPNFLFLNQRNGTFSEKGAQSGVVYDPIGKVRAGMGIDTADFDQSGHESILIGNFSREYLGLYQVIGSDPITGATLYEDKAKNWGITQPSDYFTTFGCVFVDIDNEGRPDIFTANGHVQDNIENNPSTGDTFLTYKERPLLLWNRGPGQPFQDIGFGTSATQPEVVGRGLACADIDLDGDLDVLMTTLNAAPMLLRNDGGNKNNFLRLTLKGSKSNRSAIGAEVKVTFGKTVVRRRVKSGSSYLSQSELPLTLGLGNAKTVSQLIIHWPSGLMTHLKNLPANQTLTIREGKGIETQRQLHKP